MTPMVILAVILSMAAFFISARIFNHAIGRDPIIFQNGAKLSDHHGRRCTVFRAAPWDLASWIWYWRKKNRGIVYATLGAVVIKLRVVYDED